jgi:hypothetical protein
LIQKAMELLGAEIVRVDEGFGAVAAAPRRDADAEAEE